MNIGVINESPKIENRAGLTPSSVSLLVEKGLTVYVQAGTGLKGGVYVFRGKIAKQNIAERFGLDYKDIFSSL